jgi:hypothetical protein
MHFEEGRTSTVRKELRPQDSHDEGHAERLSASLHEAMVSLTPAGRE